MLQPAAWSKAVILLAILGLVFAVVSWIVEGVTPSWVVFPILLLAGLIWMRRDATAGIALLGAAALLFVLVHVPFVLEALSEECVNPVDSDRPCHRVWWLVSLGVYPVCLLVVAILAFRERGGIWRIPGFRRR